MKANCTLGIELIEYGTMMPRTEQFVKDSG